MHPIFLLPHPLLSRDQLTFLKLEFLRPPISARLTYIRSSICQHLSTRRFAFYIISSLRARDAMNASHYSEITTSRGHSGSVDSSRVSSTVRTSVGLSLIYRVVPANCTVLLREMNYAKI